MTWRESWSRTLLPEESAGDAPARPEPIAVTLELASGTTELLVTPLGADRYRLEEDPLCACRASGMNSRLSLSGYWDRTFGGVVAICVPRDSGYDPLEELKALRSGARVRARITAA